MLPSMLPVTRRLLSKLDIKLDTGSRAGIPTVLVPSPMANSSSRRESVPMAIAPISGMYATDRTESPSDSLITRRTGRPPAVAFQRSFAYG